MVLVRSRNALFEAVIRALKRGDIPVAGADRLVLMDHIAVMDLVALARFTLLPEDDLTLATVLKTPLIGLDDDAPDPPRARRARDRCGAPCARPPRPTPASARRGDRLRGWIDDAAFKTPFAFFADVLSRDGGRRAFLARLGQEAADALDEFSVPPPISRGRRRRASRGSWPGWRPRDPRSSATWTSPGTRSA